MVTDKVGQALSPASLIALALLLCLAACSNRAPRATPLAEAYAGPAELKIHADIPTESAVVATVHHGDRLEILGQRRTVFLRVRTPSGAEGWTEARLLLGAADMALLRGLAARARLMPSQGVATTYGALPVHTEPSTGAPSFLTLKDGQKFDVLAHQIAPRAAAPRPPLIPPAPKQPKAQPRKSAKAATKIPPPPMPKPPGPPPNWQALSQSGDSETPPPTAEPAPAPVPTDDWSLIRTASGESGWILTRRLWMAIPDDVAQYSEGHRIVSYFALGEVHDGDLTKQQWLWTTIAGPSTPDYDFDSFRVFVWSLRHHRYETAYIERDIRGRSPVVLKDDSGFSICDRKNGQLRRRDFAFLNPTVRLAGVGQCEAQPTLSAQPESSASAPAARKPESLSQRLKRRWSAITGRWFSR